VIYLGATVSPETQEKWVTKTKEMKTERRFRLFGISLGWWFFGVIRSERA
jgi:hypothetical protein